MTSGDRLILERLPLSRVVLFGTRVRGDNELDSDTDVLVLVEGPVSRESEEYVRFCAWELSYKNGVAIFPLVVARAEWKEGLTGATSLGVAVGREGLEM